MAAAARYGRGSRAGSSADSVAGRQSPAGSAVDSSMVTPLCGGVQVLRSVATALCLWRRIRAALVAVARVQYKPGRVQAT